MLTADARRGLTVVLAGARNPQNIGAAARAMHDFGFSDLRVVNPFTPPFEAAQMEATSAVNAGDVMRSARIFASLPEAIADCTLVAGTTALGDRSVNQTVWTLPTAAPVLMDHLASLATISAPSAAAKAELSTPGQGKVALVFGSEKTGLTREELSFCSLLLTIPMFAPEGRHLSMNLGQAVAVCLYELTRAGFEGARALPVSETISSTSEDRERVVALLLESMEASGYSRRFPANARPEVVRQLAMQLGASKNEAATWMGFLRQVLRTLRGQNKDG